MAEGIHLRQMEMMIKLTRHSYLQNFLDLLNWRMSHVHPFLAEHAHIANKHIQP